jgi:hypothetical protein
MTSMYFDAAEQAIADLTAAVQELQGAPTVDLAPILDEIAAVKATQAAQAAELARLDGRLDAIAGAAADPT